MAAQTPSERRRSSLVEILREADAPVTGSDLSSSLGVSRQAVVNDVAILRAMGEPILGSPRGYVSGDRGDERPVAAIACRHDRATSRRETEILVDRGISILDVVVEHPLYGEVQANLFIDSRSDIDRYMEILESDAQPLSALTGGVHLHHVRAPSADALEAAKRELAEAGILLADD
jgi:transcriptional regulator of NAD metabolism